MQPLVILAGGLATRLGNLTADIPKCLIDVNGRPFIDWQLDLLVSSGYKEFVFCLSHKSNLIEDHLGDGSKWGSVFKYSLDGPAQLGTGGAIYKALPLLGEKFAVLYGDSYLPIDYKNLERFFETSSYLAMMAVFENKNLIDSSNVEFFEGKIINYKKGIKDSKMEYIDYGITYFRKETFTSWSGYTRFDLSELCHNLSISGDLGGVEVFDRFYEIGSVKGIQEFSNYLRKVEK
jgi:MurNAc alpha-1-phosphate uridylyltransferase